MEYKLQSLWLEFGTKTPWLGKDPDKKYILFEEDCAHSLKARYNTLMLTFGRKW